MEKEKPKPKTKLFKSQIIKGMLTDGKGAYYPNDKEKLTKEQEDFLLESYREEEAFKDIYEVEVK